MVALMVSALGLACSTIDSKATLIDSDGDGSPDVRDCAPDDPDIAPGIDEICDGEDQDCDGEIDENAIDATEEICDGIDNDCDGEIDEDLAITLYPDEDGDGFGDPNNPVTVCDPEAGLIEDGSDCDDANDAIHPDAEEVCDGIDNDCDAAIDEDLTTTFYADTDGDGFGDPDNTVELCEPEDGYLDDANDCDDAEVTVYPGAPESCNDGIDQDCDGEDTYCLIYGDMLLDPDADITIAGLGSGSLTGAQTGFAGDVDGDGVQDIYVSSPSFDNGSAARANVGLVDVISIDPTFTQGAIDLIQDSGTGWDSTGIRGVTRDSYATEWVRGVGDIDADGLDDLIVGSTEIVDYHVAGGTAYLVLGSSLGSGELTVGDADIIFSSSGSNQVLSAAAVPAGDINGDGFADLLLGGEGKVLSGSGRPGAVMVWLGCEGGVGNCEDPDGDGTYTSTYEWGDRATPGNADDGLEGADTFDRLGSGLAANFDFNGDGDSDILAGAKGALSGAGEVYLILDFPFSTSTAWSQAEIVLEGIDPTDEMGTVLEAPGDLDSDGYDDLIIGIPNADSSTGAVYIFFGRDDIELSHLDREMSIADVDIKLVGESTGEMFGASIAASGDVDGDGVAELMVGAPKAEPGSVSLAGEVRILRGPPAADMADDPLARISGTSASGEIGTSIAGGVDLNGDGWTEVLVGASSFDGAGAAFVLYGGYHP